MKEIFNTQTGMIEVNLDTKEVISFSVEGFTKEAVEAAQKDTGRFFNMAQSVAGRTFVSLLPQQPLRRYQKIGTFATAMLSVGRELLKAYKTTPPNIKENMEAIFPILKNISKYGGADVEETMIALSVMGHQNNLIEVLFLHFREDIEWP